MHTNDVIRYFRSSDSDVGKKQLRRLKRTYPRLNRIVFPESLKGQELSDTEVFEAINDGSILPVFVVSDIHDIPHLGRKKRPK